MPASISDNNEKIVFQGDFDGHTVRIRKTSYEIVETQQDNRVFQVDMMVRVKSSYAKNNYDLIKNDHMIFQKRGERFFLLFEADRDAFKEGNDQTLVFEEEMTTSNYDYRIMIQKNPAAKPEASDAPPETGADAALSRINAMLSEHGITDADVATPVESFMKTWKLGHPDEE